jgi:hypothetical protein
MDGLVAREAGPPTSLLSARFRRTIGKPSCARTIVRICARDCKSHALRPSGAQGGPASCGPNAEPPSRARAFRRAPLTRRVPKVPGNRTLISHGARRDNAPGSRLYLVQSLGNTGSGRRWAEGDAALRVDAVGAERDTGRDPRGAPPLRGRHRGPPSCSGAGLLWSGYSSAEIANASPNPSVVARPTRFPPRAKASGIIVSASMVRIAPAANESTKATVLGEASPKSP